MNNQHFLLILYFCVLEYCTVLYSYVWERCLTNLITEQDFSFTSDIAKNNNKLEVSDIYLHVYNIHSYAQIYTYFILDIIMLAIMHPQQYT